MTAPCLDGIVVGVVIGCGLRHLYAGPIPGPLGLYASTDAVLTLFWDLCRDGTVFGRHCGEHAAVDPYCRRLLCRDGTVFGRH